MPVPTLPELTDAQATSKSGGTDGSTGIKHQVFEATDQSTPKAFTRLISQADNVFTLLGQAAAGLVVNLKNGLKIGALPINYTIGGTAYAFAGNAEYTLTASATNYVYLDTDAVLEHSTTAWPGANHFKLAVVTTDATDVTAVSDRRFANMQVGAISNWWNYAPTAPVDFGSSGIQKLIELRFVNPSTVTLDASGEITSTRSYHTIDTYEGAATDDLVAINHVADYDQTLLILRAAHPDRTVVVKSSGNINLPDGDFVMDDDEKCIALVQMGAEWVEISRNFNTLQALAAALDAAGYAITDVGTLSLKTTELTISSGAVTKTGSCHTIDTESDAATDDLDTISGGSDGDLLLICADTPATRVPTVKHNTGNIWLQWAKDFVMNAAGKWLLLRYSNAVSKWQEVSRSYVSIADLAGTAKAIPYGPGPFYFAGALTTGVKKVNLYCPVEFTLANATGIVGTAPTGGACIIDIRDDGSSIFASQAEMINIPASQTQNTSADKNHVFAAGSLITFEFEEVNSAEDATITLNGYIAPQTPPS